MTLDTPVSVRAHVGMWMKVAMSMGVTVAMHLSVVVVVVAVTSVVGIPVRDVEMRGSAHVEIYRGRPQKA